MPTLKTPRTRAVFGGFCTPKTGVFPKDANPLLNGLRLGLRLVKHQVPLAESKIWSVTHLTACKQCKPRFTRRFLLVKRGFFAFFYGPNQFDLLEIISITTSLSHWQS